MYKRDLNSSFAYFVTKLPVVALLGPRQSGKTTLATTTFKRYRYINFENINDRTFAQEDPQRFLKENYNEYGIILDEIQHVPQLLSYIQLQVDQEDRPGYFIITGSHNLLVNQAITQSLAGRVAILTLLPLSLHELQENNILPDSLSHAIYYGGYPRVYAKNLLPLEFYPFYIQTYIERDVRQIINITNLSLFQRFLALCAGRIGQLLNLSSLAIDCGISVPTAKAWLSLLEASYIIYLLQPHYKNFSKRVIKTPKLYFYDTGIACTLLGIQSQAQLSTHYLRGSLTECLIITELKKYFLNQGKSPYLYFWQDSHGHEIDCVIDHGTHLIPIEIKSGETITPDYFTSLEYWSSLTGMDPSKGFVVYGGTDNQPRSKGNVVSWRSLNRVFEHLKQ